MTFFFFLGQISLPFGFTSKPTIVQVCKATKKNADADQSNKVSRPLSLLTGATLKIHRQTFINVSHQHRHLRSRDLTSTHLLFIPPQSSF